jgi:hypothetical protein
MGATLYAWTPRKGAPEKVEKLTGRPEICMGIVS